MSSSQPTDAPPPDPSPAAPAAPARPRRGLAGWSLRSRLVAAVIALLAAVCLVISVATTVALRQFLLDQVDQQLAALAERPDRPAAGRPPGPPTAPGPANPGRRVQPPGTLTALLVAGELRWAVTLSADGTDVVLPERSRTLLTGLPADDRPHTLDLAELGEYRLLAQRTSGGAVAVTGLPLAELRRTVWWVIAVQVAVAGVGLVAAAGAGALIVRAALRPLRRVAATAGRVAELPLDRGEVALWVRVPATDTDQRTEVGQVGAALNRMLGHVATALAARQASETRVRQFVADASHELRTPLAAIRGYAEVTRRGRERVPPDVAHALRRVESESIRMTALVDDLLLLARLDSGRPLATGPVDLSALLVDAVSDAHVAGPNHRWLLELPEAPVTVAGDAARLHQVVGNLLANARVHTPPGSSVTTRLAQDADGWAVLTVTDDGPGVPEAQQPEVFDRFARGDTSRSRAAGSTGLGLAIVAAVVRAHGGAVGVTSRPGRTEFTVRLPPA